MSLKFSESLTNHNGISTEDQINLSLWFLQKCHVEMDPFGFL